MKNKLRDILSDLKEFTVQIVLALGNKKIDYHKSMSSVFHSSAITNYCVKFVSNDKLIVNDHLTNCCKITINNHYFHFSMALFH